MADKSFGIKELNLVSSGTPKIESSGNLNLNAVTVAISTNATVGGTLDVDGHTELDDVNISGVSTFAGITTVTGQTLFTKQLGVSGFSTFFNDVKFAGASYDALWDTSENRLEFKDGASAVFGTGDDLEIKHSGGNTTLKNITGQFRIAGNDLRLQTQNSSEDYLLAVDGGSVSLFHNNNKKIETTSTGSVVTGILTATNVDSIGIITARQGVRINADSANPAGASATNYLSVGASQDLKIYHNGGTNYIAAADGDIKIRSDTFQLVSDDTAGRAIYLDNSNSRLELGFDGTAAAYFSSSNVQFAKPITASTDSQHDIGTNSVRFRNAYVDTYYGSGANLTGLTGASAATYGSATTVPQIVIDSNGKISGITNVSISGGGGAVDKIVEGNTEAEVVDTGADGHFKVKTEGTERLRINADGQVLIGQTSVVSHATGESQKLVVGTGTSENLEFTAGRAEENGGVIEYIHRGDGSTRPDLTMYVGGGAFKVVTGGNDETFRIDSTGNLGVGTSNPVGMLEVQHSSVPSIVSNYNNSKHIQIDVGNSGGGIQLTTGHYLAVNQQPYADRGTQNNLTEVFRVSSSGVVTADSFSGGGNDIVTSRWTLGADGSSHYTFTGPGGLSAATDPTIYLARGQTYEFVNSSGGSHPFQIRVSDGGSAYNTGVTNNGASSGTIKFEVPFAAPNTLVYQCTSHSSMLGNIVVYPSV